MGVMGQPFKFKTRKALITKINEYFNNTPQEEYTVTGLALVVGSKQLIQDYQKRKKYADIIKEAKLIIENSYEKDLRKNGGANNIFALKNFGWADKQEVKLDQEVKLEIQGFNYLIPEKKEKILELNSLNPKTTHKKQLC